MPFKPIDIVTRQCVKYSSFRPPPLDGSYLLPEVLDWHLKNSPEHVFYKYEDIDGSVRIVPWKEFVHAAYRASQIVLSHSTDFEGAQFAILAVSDSILFATTMAGLMRAGFAPLLVSPRCSTEVVAQLLDKAGATHVFYSPDKATTMLAQAGTAHRNVKLIPMPTHSELYDSTVPAPAPPIFKPDIYSSAMIIHTSGSTSVPKLIPISHSTTCVMGSQAWANKVDIGSLTMNFALTPLYHIIGGLQLGCAAYTGAAISVFPPTVPPIQPRVDNLLHCIVATKSDIAILMPSILEAISLDPTDVQKLAQLTAVIYGGAALNPSAGDRLADGKVSLYSGYGMSEGGGFSAILPEPMGREWQWTRKAPNNKLHYRDLQDGTYELVAISHDGHHIDVPNCELDGQPALATKDVVIRHPTDPDLFKVIGRLDDQLVLSTGEKTMANPLEAILQSDALIHFATFFGRSRPHNGVIVQPPPEHAFDPTDVERLKTFRDTIWPTVVKMNEFAPSHSRLVKEMILVASPNKPLPINPLKQTVVRALAMSAYEKEIADAYDAFETAAVADFSPPATWDLPDVLPFVRKVVQSMISDLPSDEADFFNFGCDSLKAARIHNIVAGTLRKTEVEDISLAADLPYKFPTVSSLATYTSTFALTKGGDLKALNITKLESLVEKYTESFPDRSTFVSGDLKVGHADDGLVFLVTGTTGGLGTNLIAQLLGMPNVKKVFALNRLGPAGTSLLSRHEAAFLDRGVDPSLLNLDKFVLLQGDTTQADLGIDPTVLTEIRNTATHIIHNAWPVNFNYSVQTFEPAIQGAKNLVDLALQSTRRIPPHFMFISSVSVTRFVTSLEKPALEEQVPNAGSVVGQGYPESKWVVERMLHIAGERTGLHAVSVRVGQLAGGTSGCWNVNDWVPVLVRSAPKLGCLPDSVSEISWMRLDESAASLIEMRDAPAGVLHLVHPRPTPWRTVMGVFGAPLVPSDEWLKRLVAYGDANPDGGQDVPALRLLEFWKSFGPQGFDAMADVERIDTKKARAASPTLSNMTPLNEIDAKKWFAYWKRAGVLA